MASESRSISVGFCVEFKFYKLEHNSYKLYPKICEDTQEMPVMKHSLPKAPKGEMNMKDGDKT